MTRSLQKLESAIAKTTRNGSRSRVARIRQADAPANPKQAESFRARRRLPVHRVRGFVIRPQVIEPIPPISNGKVFRKVLRVTSRWKRSSTKVGAHVMRKYQVKLSAKY